MSPHLIPILFDQVSFILFFLKMEKFMEVLTTILQQGKEFEMMAETILHDRYEQLVTLVTMMGDQGELPIAMALANVVSGPHMDELARVFVTLFDAKHMLSHLLWNIFDLEIAGSECMQTLLLGNSLEPKSCPSASRSMEPVTSSHCWNP